MRLGVSDDPDAASVHERLDDLTRQLERLSRIAEAKARPGGGSGEFAEPDQPPPAPPPAPPADNGGRLEQRVDRITGARAVPSEVERYAGDRALNRNPLRPTYANPGLDQTVAEIRARQRALDGDRRAPEPRIPEPARRPPPPASTAAPPSAPPAPAQNLTGLETQLRTITDQIESLRRPCAMEEAVPALRQELAEISRSLAEAMPRRALEPLEAEIRSLSQRVDQSRQAGVDGSALASIEHGLADVRDALRELTPSEGLTGFHSAIQSLARKVDVLAASQQDPGALQQLEAAVGGLRSIVSHVASDDALVRLSDEVRGLAAKVERIAGPNDVPDALTALERRIGGIAETLEQQSANGRYVPSQLDAVVKGLSDKIEQLQLSRGDTIAFGQLEQRVAKLVEQLDSSGARLTHLEAIERGLADLLLHLDELRSNKAAGGLRANGGNAGADSLKRDIEAVNNTLGRVVDRLAQIETDLRSGPRNAPPGAPTPAHMAPVARPMATALAAVPEADPPAAAAPPRPTASPSERLAAAAASVGRAPLAAERKPIDPNLPPDHPLEPGEAKARARTGLSPADRIAESEAALGPAKPPVIPDPAGKSNFIAAARRAAQTALTMGEGKSEQPQASEADSAKVPLRKRVAGRLRGLLVGASVIVLVFGAFRIATNLVDSPDPAAPEAAKPAEKQQPPKLSATKPPAAPVAPSPPPTISASDDTTGSIPAGPVEPAPAPATTGSLPQSSAQPSPAAPLATGLPPVSQPVATMPGKPAPGLLAAAQAGDPAAAYELGVRHIDGRGAAQNLAEAARWLEQAAKHGLAPAQFRLATLYEKGQGVKKNLATARRLYTEAAEKGNAKAMHNLAVMLAEGADGKPDYKAAAEWFRKAAERGVADSQYNLAVLYARGIGVEQNLAESYKWFTLAAAQGDKESARKRNDVGARLDAKALAAAQLAAKTWRATPQPTEAISVAAPPGGWDRLAQPLLTPTVKRIKRPAAKPAARHRPHTARPLKIVPG